VILLDTNALIWMLTGHPRARPLQNQTALRVSPVSLLELAFLHEAGRIRLAEAARQALIHDPHRIIDNPPSAELFDAAVDVDWTRDPFDRLIVAHAHLRGWRLATGDRTIIGRLGMASALAL